MKNKAPIITILLFTLSVFFLPHLKAAMEEKILVTVLVASPDGSDYDLDNDAFRDQLIQLFSYPSYRQIDQFWIPLERAKREAVSLPEGYDLLLNLQEKEKERVLVQAVIRKNSQSYVDTVLSIRKPGVVFLGGPTVENGVLILVLESRN